MSATLPGKIDATRAAQARLLLEGRLPLSALRRLRPSLADDAGEVAYRLAFERDELGLVRIAVHAEATLSLICQRTLEAYPQPVVVDRRLGVIARESDEAALPADHEPLLSADAMVSPADVIEDELILALPIVPRNPLIGPADVADPDRVGNDTRGDGPGPFAALEGWKRDRD
jgi:uncharacterized protein